MDLSAGVSDLESFLNDLIKVSTVDAKVGGGGTSKPAVEDYCRLLQRHIGSSHRFINQVLRNSKELSQQYHDYTAHATKQYRQEGPPENENTGSTAAGDFTQRLETFVSHLSESDKAKVLTEIDTHAAYLSSVSRSSISSMQSIIRNISQGKSETAKGPGAYLSRWQSLMDETPITPATAKGPVRSGRSESVREATMVDIDGETKGDKENLGLLEGSEVEPSDVSETVRLLGPNFKVMLREAVDKEA